eukprot:m.14670 g.14670  ORF g.14670 m.14670 type:complete len:56 (-) comp9247_c0_seq1:47-214(-)
MPTDEWCFSLSKHNVTLGQQVAYATRAYLNPTTKTGPDPEEVLPPTLLIFNKHQN